MRPVVDTATRRHRAGRAAWKNRDTVQVPQDGTFLQEVLLGHHSLQPTKCRQLVLPGSLSFIMVQIICHHPGSFACLYPLLNWVLGVLYHALLKPRTWMVG